MSAEFDIVEYLARKGYQGKPGAGPEVAYPCFFDCQEDAASRKRKLYINREEGFYHCKVCNTVGGTTLLRRHFGDDDGPVPLPAIDSAERRRILAEATAVGMRMLTGSDEQMLYLVGERGLSPETIIERRLGWVDRPWSLTGCVPDAHRDALANSGLVYRDGPRVGQDFFWRHLLIPYVARGQVVQLRGKVPGGKYITGPGESVRLFNTDALDDADDVIITEGEFDAMILAQTLSLASADWVRRIGVVGLAGSGATPAGFVDYFRHARRVFIGLDPDDDGKRAAIRLKDMLGTKARILELPEELPKCDWTELLAQRGAGWRDVVDLLGNASGKRLFTVGEAGVRWRSRSNAGTGVKLGYRELDDTIMPGLLPGQLLVLLAKTGAGKTVWACNVAYHTRDVPHLFISLEMTQEEVYERLRRIYTFHHPDARDDDMEEAFSRLLICDVNRLSSEELAALIGEYEVETGVRPELVTVDYLGYYARGMPGRSPYEKTSSAVMQLKAEAKTHRVAVIAPHQVNRLAQSGKPLSAEDARDSGVVEETADFLLTIWRPDDALRVDQQSQPTGKLKVSIEKSRHGGAGRMFNLQMDLAYLAVVDDGGLAARRASQHNYDVWRGVTYDDLRRVEMRPVQLTTGGVA